MGDVTVQPTKVWSCISIKCDGAMVEVGNGERVKCEKCGLVIKKPAPTI